jgi:hypothetical protein
MPSVRAAGALFGFGILVLVVGLFIAPMITDTAARAEQTVAIQDGNSANLQQNLNISASIDNQNDATVTVTDLTTFEENSTAELDPGENETVRLAGEDILITYDQFSQGGDYGVFTVQYPAAFQYSENVQFFYDNLQILLVIIAFMFVLSGAVVGVRLA